VSLSPVNLAKSSLLPLVFFVVTYPLNKSISLTRHLPGSGNRQKKEEYHKKEIERLRNLTRPSIPLFK